MYGIGSGGNVVRFVPSYISVWDYVGAFNRYGPDNRIAKSSLGEIKQIIKILKHGANPPDGFRVEDAAIKTTYEMLIEDVKAIGVSKEDVDSQVLKLEELIAAHERGERPETKEIADYWQRIAEAETDMETARERARSRRCF